ncbi:succinylglutamate desuccinylase/aspartoacylase family protein [Cryomorpha ignava]|uniref:Succinylglutamate desuccinylase/aspartoacylase family protein n=1 Tax=Cryomorpha ignava TaxID=101383 RepID=A0A7K3WQ86_9FLAO|nr:succinylglutamate desuccinylase/aspartoacylase family protein [Cryomorpha ignava]NEN23654.1 succinylglutamate desuccinylase/aspartoacylase family protein [Cryomorpha ignava]
MNSLAYICSFFFKLFAIANSEIKINGKTFSSGESGKVKANIAKLPSGTLIDLPIYVFRSKKKGPTVLLSGGLHGDEINGIEIIRRMLDESKFDFLNRGSVIAIPVMNIYGFLNFSREVPDGKDINRSFPGHSGGSLASRVAHFLNKNILTQIDYGIDFHTGGASRFNFPQVRYADADKKAGQLAEAFAPPVILKSNLIDKSLRKQAHKMGKPMLVFEGGESLRLDEEVVQEGIGGALRVLHHLKMIDHAPPAEHQPVVLGQSTWVRAKRSGIYTGTMKSGMSVGKNDTIGMITDPFSEFKVKITAGRAGFIIGHNNMPVVNQGDALIHLGLLK